MDFSNLTPWGFFGTAIITLGLIGFGWWVCVKIRQAFCKHSDWIGEKFQPNFDTQCFELWKSCRKCGKVKLFDRVSFNSPRGEEMYEEMMKQIGFN